MPSAYCLCFGNDLSKCCKDYVQNHFPLNIKETKDQISGTSENGSTIEIKLNHNNNPRQGVVQFSSGASNLNELHQHLIIWMEIWDIKISSSLIDGERF